MWTRRESSMRRYLWERLSLSFRAAKEARSHLSVEGSVENLKSRDANFVKVQTFFYVLFDLWFYLTGVVNHSLPTLERGFWCGDASIARPHYPNTVSVSLLLSVTLLVPLAAALPWEYVHVWVLHAPAKATPKQRIEMIRRYGANVAAIMIEYMLGYTMMIFVMELGKNGFGRLRPHFLTVCKPDPEKVDCSRGRVWVGEAWCTGDAHDVRVGRQSFPSGHSAAAVYAAAWLGLYLLGGLPRDGSPSSGRGLRLALVAGLGTFALACCGSRVSDCWHFPGDVAAGVLLGLLALLPLTHRPQSQLRAPRGLPPDPCSPVSSEDTLSANSYSS